jgi:DNA-directed RNA polymerase specialized sigma24 family protein
MSQRCVDGLDALSDAQREVVVLHLVDGYSFREIGGMTGVSLFTAAGRYRDALDRLRAFLGGTENK